MLTKLSLPMFSLNIKLYICMYTDGLGETADKSSCMSIWKTFFV